MVAAVQTPDYTWVETRGVADLDSEEPMSADVHHRIGSVTKTFTISLLLQAADEGLLSLNDTLDSYIEGIPNDEEITLRSRPDRRLEGARKDPRPPVNRFRVIAGSTALDRRS